MKRGFEVVSKYKDRGVKLPVSTLVDFLINLS